LVAFCSARLCVRLRIASRVAIGCYCQIVKDSYCVGLMAIHIGISARRVVVATTTLILRVKRVTVKLCYNA